METETAPAEGEPTLPGWPAAGGALRGHAPGRPGSGREPAGWSNAGRLPEPAPQVAGASATTQPAPSWTPPPGQGPRLGWPAPPAVPAAPKRTAGGVLGGLAAAGAFVVKYGLALLKFGKLGPTLISMAISVVIMAGLFGWAYGVGILVLIAIHEMGHVVAARMVGIPVTAPIFLGPLGAFINMRRIPEDGRQEAIIAIGGPIVGTAAALLVYVWGLTLSPGYTQRLLFALGYIGCLINLFNMVPALPLDGGRILGALSRWFNLLGLGLIAFLVIFGFQGIQLTPNPLLIIIVLIGVLELVRRWRQPRTIPLTPAVRVAIGWAYLLTLVLAAAGMSAAHQALIASGALSPV